MFPHLFDEDFEFDRCLALCVVARFGAEGVGFAVEFLHEEVEAAADGAVLLQSLPCLANVETQAVKLFLDVHFGEDLRQRLPGDSGVGFILQGAQTFLQDGGGFRL